MKIITIEDLQKELNLEVFIPIIEDAFKAYSAGKTIAPPVTHMHFNAPFSGDLHIKCASCIEDPYYSVKIASYFSNNKKNGISNLQSSVHLYEVKSGSLVAIFLDQGFLTHLRTAMAGAICAKLFAPKTINFIGIIGSGIQAYYQLLLLRHVVNCKNVVMWSRNLENGKKFREQKGLHDFHITIAQTPEEVAATSNLIITSTPSTSPLLFSHNIRKGTHITAVGSDTPNKQELDVQIFKIADKIYVDSKAQCSLYGETYHAIKSKKITIDQTQEIGKILSSAKPVRDNDEITVADLTGLGIQDLKIAIAFYQLLNF